MESNKLYNIPNINNYLITKDGKVFNKTRKRFLKAHNSGRGYVHYILYDNNIKFSISRHRLLCMTFKPHKDYKELEVDHINGIPGDDRLENLEWVTGLENVRRFWKTRKFRIDQPVVIRDYNNNKDIEFTNYKEAARYLGVHRYEVLRRLNARFGFLFKDFTCIKYKDDRREFPIIDNINSKREMDNNINPIKAYNHFTNELKYFDTMQEFSKYLNVSPSVITNLLQNNKVHNTGWEVKLRVDTTPFQSLCLRDLLLLKYSSKYGMACVYIKDETFRIFTKATDLASFLNISPQSLNNVLKGKGDGRIIYKGALLSYISKLTDSELIKYFKSNELNKDNMQLQHHSPGTRCSF